MQKQEMSKQKPLTVTQSGKGFGATLWKTELNRRYVFT